MKNLLIFLILPLVLFANQQETSPCIYEPIQDPEREFETSWEHSDDCPCND